MKHSKRVIRRAGCLGIVIAVALLGATGASARTKPHIVASPSTVNAGESTTLTGRGFPANTEVELIECPLRRGSVFVQCAAAEVTVTATPGGEFSVAFPVEPCPKVLIELGLSLTNARQPSEKCFIGGYEHEIDTWVLRGAVKVKLIL